MSLALSSAAVYIALMMFVNHRGCRAATFWGALWAVAVGTWLLAPQMLNVHHMPPLTFRQWARIGAFFFVTFAALGGVLGLAVTIPVGFVSLLRRASQERTAWIYAIWPTFCVPLAYLGVSAIIEWTNFARLPGASSYTPMVVPIAGLYACELALVFFVHRKRRADWTEALAPVLAAVLLMTTVAGAIVLPFRVTPPPDSTAVQAAALTGRPSDGTPTPLLVIGLDGGNWRTLQPLMDRGELPTFARLAASGLQGEVEAQWAPYWSNPAWGAILTGYSQDEIGVHEDLSARVDGLPVFELPLHLDIALNPLFAVEYFLVITKVIEPMPTPRSQLHRAPVWERLSRAGVKTAVVRFPFTYPAAGQAAFVVSNRVVWDLWDMMGVGRGARDALVEPVEQTDAVLARFAADQTVDPQVFASLLPEQAGPMPADSVVHPAEVLRRAATISEQMHATTVSAIQQNQDLSVVMLYVAGLDNVAHAFWQYRFPEDFPDAPPATADVRRLGSAVDRYAQLLDRNLRDLIDAFPTPPNVLVVSDHGEGPTSQANLTLWKGWHASPGMFLAAGPDVPHRPLSKKVSYYDIVPTILDLQGFEKPTDLRGRSLLSSH